MSDTLKPAPIRRSWLARVLEWLACLLAVLVWLAGLAALWWWLPFPARTTLATSDQLLLVGFSADGETLVTVQPAPPQKETSGDPFASLLMRSISPVYSGPLQFWDVRTGTERARLTVDWGYFPRVALSPKGNFLAAEDGAGILKLWNLNTVKERAVLPARAIGTFDEQNFWFSPDDRTLAYRTPEGDLRLWDTMEGAERMRRAGAFLTVAFSVDSKILALASRPQGGRDRVVTLWNVSGGELKTTLYCPPDNWIYDLTFSSDGKTLATGSEKELMLWDVAAAGQQVSTREEGSQFLRLKFSSDNALLVTKEGHPLLGTYAIRDAATLRRLIVLGTNEPAISPDGRVLAMTEDADIGGMSLLFAAGQPGTPETKGRAVRLLDPTTLEERGRLKADRWSSIDPPIFSPDGKFVAASGSYLPFRGLALNELKVWDANTGQEEATLRGYSMPHFSPDGKKLAAIKGGSRFGGSVTVWDVPIPSRTWRFVGVLAVWVAVPLLGRKGYNTWRHKKRRVVVKTEEKPI
jgi:WD40 repeat protein